MNDLRDVRVVAATDLTRNALEQIKEATPGPVLVESAIAKEEGRKVGRDQAKNTMKSPEEKEDGEQVMCIPKSFKVLATGLLNGREDHGHQCKCHHISRPPRPRNKVGEQEALEAEVVLGR